VAGNDRVELASYQLKDVAHIWFTYGKENRGTNAVPVTWELLELSWRGSSRGSEERLKLRSL